MKIMIGDAGKVVCSETVDQLLDEMEIKKDNIAVVKNGKIIRRKDWALERINENDCIDIFSPVSGG